MVVGKCELCRCWDRGSHLPLLLIIDINPNATHVQLTKPTQSETRIPKTCIIKFLFPSWRISLSWRFNLHRYENSSKSLNCKLNPLSQLNCQVNYFLLCWNVFLSVNDNFPLCHVEVSSSCATMKLPHSFNKALYC